MIETTEQIKPEQPAQTLFEAFILEHGWNSYIFEKLRVKYIEVCREQGIPYDEEIHLLDDFMDAP